MVGAGISCPSVPLATAIVNDCKEEAQKYKRSAEPTSTTGVDLYSHWFQTAYSEPYQRQEYLQRLIENKPITHANFRLAHLLLNNTISNIVFTTNFDDFLSKALDLFGKTHIVCDHPQTVSRINHNQEMLQIVHLHGSYWFYDCCNLRGELEDRAQQSDQTTLTMAALLSNILWDRSPIVVGYSGWEGDVFTEAFRRRLAQPLRSNAYWFCYKRSEVDSLPDWLKFNANVSFVVRKKKPALKPDMTATGGTTTTPPDQARSQPGKSTGGPAETDELLAADSVFESLIQAFALPPPELTTDPLGMFARQLDNSLPKDAASNTVSDIYAIKRVIERVTKAKQRDDEETARPAVEPSESQLDLVRDALRTADSAEVVRRGSQIDLTTVSAKDLNELADAMLSAAQGVNEANALLAYDLVVAIRAEEAKKLGSQTAAAKLQVVTSLFSKGVIFHTTNRHQEALSVYDDLLGRYDDDPEPILQPYVATTLLNKGIALGNTNRATAAIEVYDELLERYRETAETPLREQVAKALINKAVLLGILDRTVEEIALYDEVLERYGNATEPALHEQVAKALRNKGVALGTLDRGEEEVALYDELLRRYGEATEPVLREQVAMALVSKGITLGNLGRYDEAHAACLEVVRRFEQADDPVLKEQVANALNTLGFNTLIAAKALLLRNEKQKAEEELRQAQNYITASIGRIYDPVSLGNHAYVAFLLGNKDEAREILTRAIQLGGESIRSAELKDAEINRLPQDDEFCEMVRSIPVTPTG